MEGGSIAQAATGKEARFGTTLPGAACDLVAQSRRREPEAMSTPVTQEGPFGCNLKRFATVGGKVKVAGASICRSAGKVPEFRVTVVQVIELLETRSFQDGGESLAPSNVLSGISGIR